MLTGLQSSGAFQWARDSMQAFVNFLTRIFGTLVRSGRPTANRNLESDLQQDGPHSQPARPDQPLSIEEAQTQTSPSARDQTRQARNGPAAPTDSKVAKASPRTMPEKAGSASHPWHDLSAGEVSSVTPHAGPTFLSVQVEGSVRTTYAPLRHWQGLC